QSRETDHTGDPDREPARSARAPVVRAGSLRWKDAGVDPALGAQLQTPATADAERRQPTVLLPALRTLIARQYRCESRQAQHSHRSSHPWTLLVRRPALRFWR